jgi:Fic-DOC domain mobile mystery protein B
MGCLMSEWAPMSGETPIADISGLIPKDVKTRHELNAVEAENIRKVVVRYLARKPGRRQAPFDLNWCLKLHRQMFGEVWRWAGVIRRVELNLGVEACRIQTDLQSLLDDIAYWREHPSMDLIEQSARLHHRAVAIHPFENGNGRWARMMANIWIKQQGGAPIHWPEETLGNTSVIREAYLTAVREADRGEYEALIELHRTYSVGTIHRSPGQPDVF